jgi:hypothetical protein
MTKSTRLLAALVASLTFSLPVAAKLYKWVDNDGVTHYGETIPPEYADKDRTELNQSGRVIKQENVLTPEEQRAKREADAGKREDEKAALEKKRHDHTLLSTYSNEQEIDLARSRSLQQVEARLSSVNSQLKLASDNLLALQKEANRYTDTKKPIPNSLQEDLNESQERQDRLQQSLKNVEAEKASIEARYDADKVRYRELTGK